MRGARFWRKFFILGSLMGTAFFAQLGAAFAYNYDCAATFSCVADGTCIDYKVTLLQIRSEGNGNGWMTGYVDSVYYDDIYSCSFFGDIPPEGTYVIDPTTGLMQSSNKINDEAGNFVIVGTGRFYDPSSGYREVPGPAPSPSLSPSFSSHRPGLAETGNTLTGDTAHAEGENNPNANPADPSSASVAEPTPENAPEQTRKILDGLAS